jgi:sigma-B regulation protein RsbU (phosphoserine phosphatase)
MTSSLLIVDDDDYARAELKEWLSSNGFDVHVAAGGDDVFPLLGKKRLDLVLLDIEMPGTSGLDVLRQLRKRYPADVLPVMMATAKDTSGDIVGALNAGANDYVTKPFDLPVVLARIQTQCALAQARNQLERANKRMRQDLEAAARVQQTLLPAPAQKIQGVECAWHYQPCTELAGDLLGLLTLPDRRVCLYVLDVVHHGVKAALLAVMINRVLSRLLADNPDSPVEVAAALHREFPWDDRTEQYFTLQLGFLDPQAGTYRFVTAGHPGPIVLHGERAEVLRIPSSPIGLGDRLYLFSDGLVEALDVNRQYLGSARCAEWLAAARAVSLSDSLTRLLEGVGRWCTDAPPHDDITIAAIERV